MKGGTMKNRLLPRLALLALLPGLSLGLAIPAGAAEPRPTGKALLGALVGPTAKDAAHAGAVVREVTPDGPAAKAGLKNGDIVIKADDKEVADPQTLVGLIQGHKPGDKVKLQVLRDGKEQMVEVTLGERKLAQLPTVPKLPGVRHGVYLGVQTQELTPELKARLKVAVDKGVVVVDVLPHSPAAKAGLKTDDVITGVDAQTVAKPEELRAAIQKMSAGKEITVKVLRGKETKEIKVQVAEMPLGLSWMQDFDKRFPMDLPPGLHPDLERRLQEIQKWLREYEEQPETSSR